MGGLKVLLQQELEEVYRFGGVVCWMLWRGVVVALVGGAKELHDNVFI